MPTIVREHGEERGKMGDHELLEKMSQAIIALDKEAAVAAAEEAIAANMSPLKAIEEGLQPGIQTVGDRFEAFECFLPELIGSAEAFKAAMDVLEPVIAKMSENQKSSGTVVMGTVKGDIHKIGKDIVVLLLKTRGFKVIDLGEDIPASEFLKAAQKHDADIIGLSALLNTTMPAQQEVIKLFSEEGIRGNFTIMVGGAPVSQKWADEIGADGYAKTAEEAVKVALDLMKKKAA
jgi:corrinoid protein of di/trimethylamine methyltransferase